MLRQAYVQASSASVALAITVAAMHCDGIAWRSCPLSAQEAGKAASNCDLHCWAACSTTWLLLVSSSARHCAQVLVVDGCRCRCCTCQARRCSDGQPLTASPSRPSIPLALMLMPPSGIWAVSHPPVTGRRS